ncbi:hypothetical protein [uncultured Paraglaciecola sp.]|uniref:hypothetical protein n=1 Tax=uncultured Paraglaciecola sp. TaxID=1765024 RepID=UPI00262DFA50|nr:hypothetical protein [uncultured Paraglaciecola sp.]
MIVVEVKLHSAVTNTVTTLGRAIIANDGTGGGARRNYDAMIAKKVDAQKEPTTANLGKIWAKPLRRGRVEDYPAPSYNMWRLVIRALKSAFPEEK